ncbi:hypothetical protein BaRGS_00017814 [Batillaria attramentaria]|uniref:Uncharacterized protein n=1 Tax=Batillaria attramentaria TaxID=370345 RepID=A0ABD0KV08_9CAEN
MQEHTTIPVSFVSFSVCVSALYDGLLANNETRSISKSGKRNRLENEVDNLINAMTSYRVILRTSSVPHLPKHLQPKIIDWTEKEENMTSVLNTKQKNVPHRKIQAPFFYGFHD